jgi:hypothetical protein
MTDKPEHLYKVSYKIETNDPPITADQARERAEQGWGACDAVLMASILFPEDGSYSVLFASRDGRTDEELSENEMFKVWMMLANRLAQSDDLDSVKRAIAQTTWEIIVQSIFGHDPPDSDSHDEACEGCAACNTKLDDEE